ncbi:MAG: C-terminal target protein [Bacteroidetes bacterium]|nr:C-terminal target protein [Bacteroidota bacterium]
MRKILLISCLILCGISSVWAQLCFPGTPKSFKTEGLSLYVPTIEMPSIDNQKLLNEDALLSDKGTPLRVGVNHNVTLNMNNSGRWDVLPNGDRVWRLSVKSEGAASLHFNMNQFKIPAGAEVFIYSPDHQYVAGLYDQRSVLPNGEFFPQDIPGDEMILEYYQPVSVLGTPEISIYQVGHLYRQTTLSKGYHGDAVGDCHINVICEEVNPWRDQANSVVLIKITQGTDIYVCSGAMINNTRQDNTPYVFTAEHCYDPAVTAWRFVFQYQTNTCDGTAGSYNKYAIGANVVARNEGSDFMLLQITGTINETYKPTIFLAGWDRSTNTPTVGAAIHHPGGDYKKFSLPRNVTPGNGNYTKFWKVGWLLDPNNKGTTEPGSSGSPLFNGQGYIVGSLCCGTSSCTYIDQTNVGPSGYDHYGKLAVSWTSNNTTNTSQKLQPWLDQDNWGNTALAGRYWNNSVSVNSTPEIPSFKISPNPSNGEVTFSELVLDKIAPCKVYDALGKLVFSSEIDPFSSLSINLSSLQNGVYFVEIVSNNQILRSKLMIAK